MTYSKGNFLQDLKRLARGKPTRLPVRVVADWALSYLTAETTLPDEEVKFLESLYRLEDPR